MANTFVTKNSLARLAGVDIRNKWLRDLMPDAFLLLGSRRVGLYLRIKAAPKQPLVSQAIEQVTINP